MRVPDLADSSLLDGLPGACLMRKGLADLVRGVASEEALLISTGRPNFCSMEVEFSDIDRRDDPERKLYARLRCGESAYAEYNALLNLRLKQLISSAQ